MKNIYFVGTAGSGKSTMVAAFKDWLDDNGVDSVLVNLDPGVDKLPYDADIDIREWISLDEVMDEYNLGPNGAQIAAADLMAMNINKITDVLETYKTRYVIIDTPGQLELFAFRESSNAIVKALGKNRSMVAYLSDPTLCKSPNGFVSSMMLSALVQFRLQLPTMNVLSKADVFSEDQISRMVDWYNNPDSLYGDLLDDMGDSQTVVGMELFKAMENMGVFGEIRPISAQEYVGLEEIYASAQLNFFGGEDADSE